MPAPNDGLLDGVWPRLGALEKTQAVQHERLRQVERDQKEQGGDIRALRDAVIRATATWKAIAWILGLLVTISGIVVPLLSKG